MTCLLHVQYETVNVVVTEPSIKDMHANHGVHYVVYPQQGPTLVPRYYHGMGNIFIRLRGP